MNRWVKPDDYMGFSPNGDYVLLSKHRDSELIDRSNWDVACEQLGAKAYDDGNDGYDTRPVVYHWRASHCLVGWVEYLMVRADAPAATVAKATKIERAIANYPILDETHYSEQEYNGVNDYWQRCSVRERVDYLREAGLSIFAARRLYLPENDNGRLYERLATGL